MPRVVVAPDAATRLAVAAEWLAAQPLDAEVLVVGPTWEACDDLVRSAVVQARARFGTVRLTLDRLAARLATPVLAADGRVPAGGLSVTAVAARAVHLLRAEDALRYFAPVAGRPGFPAAVARTLEELRMNDVPPAAQRLARRAAGASLRGLDAAASGARRDRHPALLAGRGAGSGGDRARRAGGRRPRRPLRPDGGPPPLAHRLPRASGGGLPAGGHPGVLRARHEAARSRRARAPGAPRLRGREALGAALRRVPLARAGPRSRPAGGPRAALGPARARPAADRAGNRAPRRSAPARSRLGRGGRRQPARAVALGAPPRRLVGDRRQGALGAQAGRARARACAPPGGDRRRGRAARRRARPPARRPRAPSRLRTAAHRPARRAARAGDVGRVAGPAPRDRHGRAPEP